MSSFPERQAEGRDRAEAAWIDWSGGENPVPGKAVQVRTAGAGDFEGASGAMDWSDMGESRHQIVSYRTVERSAAADIGGGVAHLTLPASCVAPHMVFGIEGGGVSLAYLDIAQSAQSELTRLAQEHGWKGTLCAVRVAGMVTI